MGSGTFNFHSYAKTTRGLEGKTREEVFESRGMKKELNPHNVKMRESRDGPDHPLSNAIIVALDVTGSMGMLAETIARKGLGVLFNSLLNDRPVTDPQLMFMGIGDATCDQAPLQVSQFESDNRVVEQLAGLYLEGGGGGNRFESYHLPWYFAATHTSIDCFEKRGRKGYLFTIGDEETPAPLAKEHILRFIGDHSQKDFTAGELYSMASETYHVYHVIIEEGSHARSHPKAVRDTWNALLGQRALSLSDHTKLAEGITAVIAMNEEAMGHTMRTGTAKVLPGYMGLLK